MGNCAPNCAIPETKSIRKVREQQNLRRLVRLTGIEPVRPCGHKILSLGRLPIPPQSLTRNKHLSAQRKAKTPLPQFGSRVASRYRLIGGAVRSRTGLTGFAIRGITALLPRQTLN